MKWFVTLLALGSLAYGAYFIVQTGIAIDVGVFAFLIGSLIIFLFTLIMLLREV